MVITENGKNQEKEIHILYNGDSPQHYIFNTKTNKIAQFDSYINKIKYKDVLNRHNNIISLLSGKRNRNCNWWLSLKIGDMCDVRDRLGRYYVARIQDIKQKGEKITNDHKLVFRISHGIESASVLDKYTQLRGFFVTYIDLDEQWNEWIYIEENKTICNCLDQCDKFNQFHRIAPLSTQPKLRWQWKYGTAFCNPFLYVYRPGSIHSQVRIVNQNTCTHEIDDIYYRYTNKNRIKYLIW